jgi:membrane fusion protein, multidrug efflux system
VRVSVSVAVVACVVVLGVAAPGCRRASGAGDDNSGVEPVGVAVEVASQQTLRLTARGAGIVVPTDAGDWSISASELGRILELPKAEGDAVQSGDVLVRFEYGSTATESSARESDVSAASSRLDAARAQLAKVSALYERGFVSRSEYEAAKSAVTAAELDVNRATRQLDTVKEAADRATVRARFPGIVAKVFHHEGDLVNPSPLDPVLRVIDPTHLEVSLSVPMQEAAQVQPGMPATIVSANGAEPGAVLLRSPADDPHATTETLRLSFAQPTTLPVESPVQAEILIAERKDVVTLPSAAILHGEDGGSFVMVAVDGRAHRRDVRLGLRSRERVEIAAGVTAGDRVIVKGPADVAEGAPVSPDR